MAEDDGRFIVKYKDKEKVLEKLSPYLKESSEVTGQRVGVSIKVSKDLSDYNILVVESNNDSILSLQNDSSIEMIEKDVKISAVGELLTWYLYQEYVPEIHSLGILGDNVKIGIVDSGVDYNNDEISHAYKGGYDFVNDDPDPMDDEGHGTSVASLIFSEDDEDGLLGISPHSELYALKVLDQNGEGYTSDLILSIVYAMENDIDILVMSLGSEYDSVFFEGILQDAYDAGVILVAAAGNEGGLIGGGVSNVMYPAKYDTVIAVSAFDEDFMISEFSSRGPEVELSAPGNYIIDYHLNNEMYVDFGTSLSAPQVAGLIALYKSVNPGLSNDEIRGIIHNNVIDLGDEGKDDLFGYGFIDSESLFGVEILENETDSDNDGVYNDKDSCPITFGEFCNGCPEPICGVCKETYCPTEDVPFCINLSESTSCGEDEYGYSCVWGNDKGNDTGYRYTSYMCDGKGECVENISPWLLDEECLDLQYCYHDNLGNGDENYYCKDVEAEIELVEPHGDHKSNDRRVILKVKTNKVVRKIEYKYGNNDYRGLCSDCSEYEKYIYLDDGDNEIIVRATDYDLNYSYDDVHVFVDFRDPQILGTYPKNNEYTDGEFIVYYDEENFKQVILYFGDEAYVNDSCDGNLCKFVIDVSSYDGQKVPYYLEIEDIVGNKAESRVSYVYVDISDPVLNVKSGFLDIYSDRRVLFDLNVSEAVELSYIDLSDGRERRLCSRCSGYDREKSFRDGWHDVIINARDGMDHIDSFMTSFYVDSRKPRINGIEPRRYMGGEFYVRYSEDNCSLIRFNVNDSLIWSIPCESGKNIEVNEFQDVSSLEGQEVDYTVEVVDIAGNSYSKVGRRLVVDTIAPKILDVGYLVDDLKVYLNITLDSEARYLKYSLVGGKNNSLCSNCDSFYRYKYLDYGVNDIVIWAEDKAGNVDLWKLVVVV